MENYVIKIVPSDHSGQRLDSVIAKLFPDFSRSKLKNWLDSGSVFLNDDPLMKPSKKVTGGEEIKIFIKEERIISAEPQDIPFEVIHESKDFIVVNKSAGMVVHPGAGNYKNTLLNALLFKFPELENLPRAGIVHRLDKDTSGLMIVARNQNAYKNLSEQISQRLVKRTYQAFVVGNVSRSGIVEEPIGRHPRNRQKQAVTNKGKYALTKYSIVKKYGNYTHLEVNLETGRTHQIRIHCSEKGYPIIGDELYGGGWKKLNEYLPEVRKKINNNISIQNGHYLHASSISFLHPKKEKKILFKAQPSKEFSNLFEMIKNEEI